MLDFVITNSNMIIGVDTPPKGLRDNKNRDEAAFVIARVVGNNNEVFIEHSGTTRPGKSEYALLCQLEHIGNQEYRGVIACKGGFEALWIKAKAIFRAAGGKPLRGSSPKFIFPSGAEVHFKRSCYRGIATELIATDESRNFIYGGGRGCGKTASFFAENED